MSNILIDPINKDNMILIENEFWLDKTEVTIGDYIKFQDETGYLYPTNPYKVLELQNNGEVPKNPETFPIGNIQYKDVKCYRLFRPKFSKVKTSFFAQIPQVSNTLTQSEGVCDYTLV